MAIRYHKAGKEDVELLVKTRVRMLKSVNNALAEADFSPVEKACRDYYLESFEKDLHVAYLVFDGETFICCGGVSFYQVMPNYKNPSGRKAYIMNMYTAQAYRGRGVATQVIGLLVKEAHARNIHVITLDATDMGRPVYERCGFVPDAGAMKYKAH